ncbi:hypothetical protein ITJ38_17920 [Agreia pratensis]|uniref:hypothetical protein n=1 Tax=Agreia pratensis TaxID=150121 RepID=UPI00188BFE9B|nr:hypothetical protein [Agreia pratensis]MBF4636293.1 hypothetical protein [Agreia pratensis]
MVIKAGAKKSFAVVLSSLVVAGLLASCGLLPERAPAAPELVGTWVYEGQADKVSTLVLSEGGTFTIDQIPSDAFSPHETGVKTLDWTRVIPLAGAWSVPDSAEVGSRAIELKIDPSAYGVEFDTYLGVSNNGPSPTLYYYYGDPDNGNRVEYKRSQ